MPTENRSSNTEMVSVPRELTREMLNGVCMHPDLARSLWAALLKNAPQQRQDNPAALAIPDECPHLILFDDTQVELLIFAGAGARAAALKKWESISTSWNAHLFVRVARNSRDDGHQCAAVADPGEVEQLREHVSAYKASRERLHEWLREEQLKNVALRAQLAELVSAVRSINYGPAHAVQVRGDDEPCYPQRKEWVEWLLKLCDAACAEPSAPALAPKLIGIVHTPPAEYDEP